MKKIMNIFVCAIMAMTMIGGVTVNAKAEVEDYTMSDIVASAKNVDAEGTKYMRVLHVGMDTYRIFIWKENDTVKTDVWYVNEEDPWEQLVTAMNYLMTLGDPE